MDDLDVGRIDEIRPMATHQTVLQQVLLQGPHRGAQYKFLCLVSVKVVNLDVVVLALDEYHSLMSNYQT